MTNTPVGLLNEERLMAENPSRRTEILDHAIRIREQQKIILDETDGLVTFHPVRIAKVLAVTGLVTFVLALVISQMVYAGHAYASAKAFSFDIPTLGSSLSLGMPKTVSIGSYIPTSTPLALASSIPNFGLNESIEIALLAMALVFVEKLVTIAVNWKKARLLKHASRDLDAELKVLHEWRSNG